MLVTSTEALPAAAGDKIAGSNERSSTSPPSGSIRELETDAKSWSIKNTAGLRERTEPNHSRFIEDPRVTRNRGESRWLHGTFVCTYNERRYDYIVLSRQRADKCVAVLAVPNSSQFTAELNPRDVGLDYGPIPRIENLTIAMADQLWCIDPAKLTASSTREYELISAEGVRYTLELVFQNNHVQKYRFSSLDDGVLGKWIFAKQSGRIRF